MTTFWNDDWDAHNDYDEEQDYLRREAEADSYQDKIDAGECICRNGLGPYDPIDGPLYWADTDCPQHGDYVDDDED